MCEIKTWVNIYYVIIPSQLCLKAPRKSYKAKIVTLLFYNWEQQFFLENSSVNSKYLNKWNLAYALQVVNLQKRLERVGGIGRLLFGEADTASLQRVLHFWESRVCFFVFKMDSIC